MKNTAAYRSLIQYAGLLGVLALLIVVFASSSENFLQARTFISIANQIPDLTLVAVGMTLVLVVGGIDLSVGSILAFSSAVLGALMVDWQWSLWASIPFCILAGAACGLFNGCVSVLARIPSFIVTLGMLEIARGGTKLVTDSQTKYIGQAVESIGQPIAGLSLSPAFLMAIAAVVGGQLLLTRTVFGRYCVAIGTNEEAVRMSGVRPAPYAIGVFVISGVMCGLAGLTYASRLSTADPNAAIGLELSAIAACVIGGTSLMGGRGNVINSFLGVLIIAVLQTGLAQIGVSDPMKQIITGSVIVVAVLLDAIRSRWGNTAAS
ncbi:Ribose transport system permease protein RbsC [Rosistilla carotiformis]|uniref:Ribose transport system permease protein RbsC n=1 Tax=Rosistilla carotiformis TaxID=2528017 RepID=A0A518K1P6_9BACT|nr:ABC transporter permease [Rosistilla carotiformis]QDV71692.1 Ribose transport system permease protein RbsC [Rosistilla carotiformis]